ncbi:hypothetical protein U27_04113 [Candidatus Vecturithrix granuli]|uniref:Methyltransferase type 11 domain-containing protein n=1 Tax=Vecturithrix granuli TaxID=1499967 RepID=A0A081BXU3_VECG1|nr:hypothetical protein U27_04113 [Candidatus Vecturithrix granuli]
MKILNLGCGTKTSASPEVINIDWSIYLRFKKNPLLRVIAPLFVKGERLERFHALPTNIMVHNLSRGIPFASDSIDAIYHSHLLEHLDRNVAERFLIEVKRVLKPGGIHRIVVPDFEQGCRQYVEHIALCDVHSSEAVSHEHYIEGILEQSVRQESSGTRQQSGFRRLLENLILGDARRRGETHQWMYDRISLCQLLALLGYKHPRVCTYNVSLIPHWSEYRLEVDECGNEYKPASLYVEAEK